MKRSLSLTLSFVICLSGLVTLTAAPTRAQEVASADSVVKLREEYARLLAVDRDPSTPSDVRELNRTFLEERRAQLVAALRESIDRLRRYQSGVAASLGERESRAVGGRIQLLVEELKELQPVEEPAAPWRAPSARPSRRSARTVRTAPAVNASYAAAAQPAATAQRAEPTTADAPEPAAAAPAQDDAAPAPIVISSPGDGTTVGIDRVEVEVTVNNEEIDDLLVAVYAEDQKKYTGSRTVEVKRSDKGKKKVPLSLSKGENRIEVTSSQAPNAKATAKVTYKPADVIGAPEGRNSARQANSISAPADEVMTEVNPALTNQGRLEEARGGPFGLLVGGVVLSQQAQEFQQSDPFFGFSAGYISKMKGAWLMSRNGDCGTDTRSFIRTKRAGVFATDEGKEVTCVNGQWVVSDSDTTARLLANEGFRGWRWNLRFQGIFESNGRAAKATETANTDNGQAQQNQPFTFIASRKTFDLDAHLWLDFWANSAFSIGPYAAVGASTVLDRNELQGEAVALTDQNGSGGNGNTNVVATQARSDNDLKKFYEGGALMNIMLNRDLFAQAITAYGHYEALAGLYDTRSGCTLCDSQHRFVGKLRLFPFGLARPFGRQVKMAPMFGVEVNAGRGPDHVKFFTGFAMRIKAPSIGPVPAQSADTGGQSSGGSGGGQQ